MCRNGSLAIEAEGARRLSRMVSRVVLGGLCALVVAACGLPGSVKPTVKLGLSAPFEGLHRDLGYEVLQAVQLAVRERNARGGVGQRCLVEVVALNDYNEADMAVVQARKMAVDPGILGVLGGWSRETREIAWQYDVLGLAFLAPDVDISQLNDSVSVGSDFATRSKVQSGGETAGPVAVWAYVAANHLMDAMEGATLADGCPTRSGVREAVDSLRW